MARSFGFDTPPWVGEYSVMKNFISFCFNEPSALCNQILDIGVAGVKRKGEKDGRKERMISKKKRGGKAR